MITTLINKRDNFEVIRDQVGMILTSESSQSASTGSTSVPRSEWLGSEYLHGAV